MNRYLKPALQDLENNRFLTLVAIMTIALSVFIVSAFVLFFLNADDMISSWKRGIRIMVYLSPEISASDRADMEARIRHMAGVSSSKYISKEEGMELLKKQMSHQSSLLDNLSENPLPDAIEVRMTQELSGSATIEALAVQLGQLPYVEDVEYGQQWLGRFVQVFSLFQLVGYGICCLFFMATAFIAANTIRLVLYTRREEIEIMRLVGASDMFIKTPFYLEAVIQGAVGGLIGILASYITFAVVSSNLIDGFSTILSQMRFFSFGILASLILGSTIVGWFGCFLSLRQFLKA